MHTKRLTLTEADHAALAAAIHAQAVKPRPAEPRVRCRKGPKKHSVNRERSREQRIKAGRIKLRAEANLSVLRVFRGMVRAYWRGDRETHPGEFNG